MSKNWEAIFEERATVQRMLDFEAALAKAEAENGVIPKSAPGPIALSCKADLYDLEQINSAAEEGREQGDTAGKDVDSAGERDQ